jgi:hypothetical protein
LGAQPKKGRNRNKLAGECIRCLQVISFAWHTKEEMIDKHYMPRVASCLAYLVGNTKKTHVFSGCIKSTAMYF